MIESYPGGVAAGKIFAAKFRGWQQGSCGGQLAGIEENLKCSEESH